MNNVGIFEPKPFAEIPDADWLRLCEINVMSGVRLTRHYLAGMLEKNWKRILFVSSESAVQIPVEMVHYGMTKTAQIVIARGVAESVSGTGVTVNSSSLLQNLDLNTHLPCKPLHIPRMQQAGRLL